VGCASLLSRWNFPASFMIVNALGIRLGESGCQCRVQAKSFTCFFVMNGATVTR
jgi:hypothetical protein